MHHQRRVRLLVSAGLACYLSTVASAQEPPVAPAAPASTPSSAQSPRDDDSVQFPTGLANSFVTVNVGSIGYAFSEQQLAPGHSVGSIDVPHTAASVVLFGHHFSKHVSVQGSYMRPIKYVRYQNLDGTDASQTVWMHYGTVTAQVRVPVARRLSVFGEGGLAITSRRGFELGDRPAVTNAQFASALFGGGIEYRLNTTLDLVVGTSVIPARSQDNNPATIFTSAGIRFNMRPVPPERVAEIVAAGYIFPRTIVQVGYATYGGRAGAYLPVIHAVRDILTFLQVQHYNSGPVQRQSLLSRDGPDFLGRRRQGQTKRREPAVGAQRVPHQEGVCGGLRRELFGMEEPAGKRPVPHAVGVPRLEV